MFRIGFPQKYSKQFRNYDQHVVNLAAKFITELNTLTKFINLLEEFNKKDESFWSIYQAGLQVRLGNSSRTLDNYDYLTKFLELNKSGKLEKLIEESMSTTDLYKVSPVSILDDMINSYNLNLGDEQHIDCY